MNKKTVDHRENATELQSAKSESVQPSGLSSRWSRMWQSLLRYLQRSNEPQVRQRHDRFSNVYWIAFDPASGRSLLCSTEQEVRIWLEQLRYR